MSPPLEWKGEPAGTKSFAITVEDPDAPGGVWCHWLLFDIPSDTHAISQGARVKFPARSGKNDFGRSGYGGPCPPRGHGPHRYFFKVYALDVPELGLSENVNLLELEKALRPHVLATAEYMGRFERR